jgi:hypothetical protein
VIALKKDTVLVRIGSVVISSKDLILRLKAANQDKAGHYVASRTYCKEIEGNVIKERS